MKTPRPGQLCTINNVVYRAYKRQNDCKGCSLNSLFMCPNIIDRRTNARPPLDCIINGIILKRV